MDNTFTYSLIISLVYIIIKFIEKKLILKNNNKSLKDLIKESIIVYLSSFLGIYVVEQYNSNLIIKEPTAFTENPSF